MNTPTAATLVILTAANGCDLDNIERATPVAIPMSTVEECEKKAEPLDKRNGVRAFCISEGADQ